MIRCPHVFIVLCPCCNGAGGWPFGFGDNSRRPSACMWCGGKGIVLEVRL